MSEGENIAGSEHKRTHECTFEQELDELRDQDEYWAMVKRQRLFTRNGPPRPIEISSEVLLSAYFYFVEQVIETYRDFFLDHAELRTDIQDMLGEIQEGMSVREMFDIADDAMAYLSAKIEYTSIAVLDDRKQDVGEVYKSVVRTLPLGRTLFSNLILSLLQGVDTGPVNRIISPGCGQFFEAAVLDELFSPHLILGQDQNDFALTAAMEHTKHLEGVAVQLRDLSIPLSRTPPPSECFDMSVVIHPNILDVDTWGQRVMHIPFDEYYAPLSQLKGMFDVDCMSSAWKTILCNTIARLRKDGLLLMVFYEQRELDLAEMYLSTLPSIEIVRTCSAPGNTVFLFVQPPDKGLKGFCEESYQWVVMRNYHKGLVARKL